MKIPEELGRERGGQEPRRTATALNERVGGLSSLSPEAVLGLVHDLEVHRAQLEMQNDELRSARRELERSRDRYADLYDFAPVGYVTFDVAGRVLEVNLTGAVMVGAARSVLVGRPFASYVERSDHAAFFEHVRSCVQEGKSGTCDLTLRCGGGGGGELVPVQLQTTPVEDSGNVPACRTAITSLAERVRMMQALQHATQTAETANRAKSELLANTSHELRTPINAILGMNELALGEEISPAAREYLMAARDSAVALKLLIDELLDLSRIEARPSNLDVVPFSIRSVVKAVVEMLRRGAVDKGLAFVAVVDPETPDLLVGDPFRIRQILDNLISNAVKFTAHGSVSTRVGLRSELPDGVELELEVADTGVGIAAEHHERIFEAFAQMERSTSQELRGAGLGLAIVARLASAMGGRTWVESERGAGSKFHVTMRLRRAPAGTSDPGPAANGWTRPSASTPPRPLCKPLRVLLIEDTRVNQLFVARTLAKRGHATEVAGNGHEALQLLQDRDYDVVLMDVQMPLMDGYQATAAIRGLADETKSRLPIVAMTAHAMAGDRERCLAAGMNTYLTKPIDSRLLVELVEQLGTACAR